MIGGIFLNRFDVSQEIFTRYRHDPNAATSLSSNFILSLFEDKAGYLPVSSLDQEFLQKVREIIQRLSQKLFANNSANPILL